MKTPLIACIAILFSSFGLKAQLTNASFESNLAGWQAGAGSGTLGPQNYPSSIGTDGSTVAYLGGFGNGNSSLAQSFKVLSSTYYSFSFTSTANGQGFSTGPVGVVNAQITSSNNKLLLNLNSTNLPVASLNGNAGFKTNVGYFIVPAGITNATLTFTDVSGNNGANVDPVIDDIRITPISGTALLGRIDYSDSFTTNSSRPNTASVSGFMVESNAYNPATNFIVNGSATFLTLSSGSAKLRDASGNPGAISGVLELNGSISLPYGLRQRFLVQADVVMPSDYLAFSNFNGGGGVSVIVRKDQKVGTADPRFPNGGLPGLSLSDGTLETPATNPDGSLTKTSINDDNWHTVSVYFDNTSKKIAVFVDSILINTIDLDAFAGGRYKNVSAQGITIGGSSAPDSSWWIDNFTIGAPGVFILKTVVPTAPVFVSTYAGVARGSADGFRTNASFYSPIMTALDPLGRIWVTEASLTGFSTTENGAHRIRIIDTDGYVTTLTGGPNSGSANGTLAQASFNAPQAPAFDSKGNAYIVDRANHRIRKIDKNGLVSTFAGSIAGYADGNGVNASFNTPLGIGFDAADNMYVSDFVNYRIRKITPNGDVTTYAGAQKGFQDGPRLAAGFDSPDGIWVLKDGTVFVADWGGSKVRKISPDGIVSTFANVNFSIESVSLDADENVYITYGPGVHGLYKYYPDGTLAWSQRNNRGYLDGPATNAQFSVFGNTTILPNGDLIIADVGSYNIRKITVGDPNRLLILPNVTYFTNFLSVTFASGLPNSEIRYTTNGSIPTLSSPAFTKPIIISTATTFNASTFINNTQTGSVATATFLRIYAVDGDGISTSWRQLYFGPNYATDPRADANADPDQDGSSNIQEFIAGTNPVDPGSGFKIEFRAIPLLSWTTLVNSTYNIQRRPSLSSGTFTTLATIKATNSTTTFIDLDAGISSSQFYYTIQRAP